MKKNNIAIAKYSGAGNDFIIIDLRKQKLKLSKAQRKTIVKKLCDRNFSVGADGLLFLEKAKNLKNKFAWDFYNQDGSSAEMCLNASRCVTLFELKSDSSKKLFFESRIGIVEGRVINSKANESQVEVAIPLQPGHGKKVSLNAGGKKTVGYLVDSGVPHFVLQKHNFLQAKEKETASQIRWNKKLKPKGANVTYWEKTGKIIRAATFERGVEDFTLACGTGAAAIGIMFDDLFDQPQVSVQMPGGKISVTKKLEKILVRGPAKKIFEAKLNLKDIL